MSACLSVLEVALLAEAPKQWEHFQRNRVRRQKGKVKWQREIEELDSKVADTDTRVEELRRKYDPELIRVGANLDRKIVGGLWCPKCHDPNWGNMMNGKPWCLKCNIMLESPFPVKKRLPMIKMLPKTKRLNATFTPLDGGSM